jgi:uncharacterized protein YegL
MRRLPIFLVLDVSESMVGENLAQMEEAIGTVVANLRTDPHALDTVYLSVIAFAGIARTLADLQDLATFRAPRLPLGSGTALGGALVHVMNEIDRQVKRADAHSKGDWAPIVYLFTDGKPTDAIASARARWLCDYAPHAAMAAVAIGRYADRDVLRSLTEHVAVFDDRVPGGFEVFVRWMTASMQVQSQRLGESGGGRLSLAKPDQRAMAMADDADARPACGDPDCVVLVGRCQSTRRPYLLKYERESVPIELEGFSLNADGFLIAGVFALTEEYFDWSGAGPSGAGGARLSTAELTGTAPCPHCGNRVTIAQCGCGKLLCMAGPGAAECPWCDADILFASGGEDFEVERRLG